MWLTVIYAFVQKVIYKVYEPTTMFWCEKREFAGLLNMHFSPVFTREDTSLLPVPETKFNGPEGERLGQLVVTPEVVDSKIYNMQEKC